MKDQQPSEGPEGILSPVPFAVAVVVLVAVIAGVVVVAVAAAVVAVAVCLLFHLLCF